MLAPRINAKPLSAWMLDKAPHQLGRRAKIPVETCAPRVGFLVKKAGQIFGGNTPQFDDRIDLAVGQRGHSLILP